MTPKEKAKKLVNKYYQEIADSSYPEGTAKECALIAVDEILNAINPFGQFLGKDYWQEVKQEIFNH